MSKDLRSVPLAVGLMFSAATSEANVTTDWDAKAARIVPPSTGGLREMAIMRVSVNLIDRRYRPYVVQFAASPATSQEAAAMAASARVLIHLRPRLRRKPKRCRQPCWCRFPRARRRPTRSPPARRSQTRSAAFNLNAK